MRKLVQRVRDFSASIWSGLIRSIDAYWGVYFGILLIILLLIGFTNLGLPQIEPWDEARHGVNAYEMLQNRDFIRTTYQYATDYWNLKPPLSAWIIALSYRIFGFHAFALRFYSALSYLVTCLIVSLSVKRHYGKVASLTVLLMFAVSFDVFFNHMARAGDADALFVLLYTISMLSVIRYTETENSKLLYLASLAFAFAFLAKSFHAGCIVVTMALILIAAKKLRRLTLVNWIVSVLCAVLPIAVWAVARYVSDGTVFLKDMFAYDLVTRSSEVLDGHVGTAWYYVMEPLRYWSVRVLLVMTAAGSAVHFAQKRSVSSRTVSIFLWAAVPVVLFSFVKTKLNWYIYPANIALIILGSVSFSKLFCRPNVKLWTMGLCAALLLFSLKLVVNNIESVIDVPDLNPTHAFLRTTIQRDGDRSGADCYIDTGDWTQDELLQAELSGGFVCIDGGYEAFRKANAGAHILMTDLDALPPQERARFEIVAQDERCSLLRKP
ncbi:MAG: hypothetical protein GX417_02850 [Clostridiales bacterium]|nr:hypothetical protein [Clostridiales bacterium]